MRSITNHIVKVHASGKTINPATYCFQQRAELKSKFDRVLAVFPNLFASRRSQILAPTCQQSLLKPEQACNKTVSELPSRSQVVEGRVKLLDRFGHTKALSGICFNSSSESPSFIAFRR